MPKSKRQKKRCARKQFSSQARKRDARRWLASRPLPDDLVNAYAQRYSTSAADAHLELLALGYDDDIRIQAYEREGIEWEYKYDGYRGEMYVVPRETPDWELPEYW